MKEDFFMRTIAFNYNIVVILIMERPRGINLTNLGGVDPLCTLHRAEGLYG